MTEEELQQLVTQSLGGVGWEYDLDTDRIIYSAEFFALIGYDPDEREIDTDWVADNIHPEDLAQWRESFVNCVKGESKLFDCELRFRHRDGQYVWIQTRGVVTDRAADGRARRIAGLVFDISERRASKESESRYRLFLDNIPDALSLKDRDGRYIYINRQFERWLGKASYQIYGQTAAEIFQPETQTLDELATHEQQVWNKGEPISMERQFPVTEDGQYRHAVITKFPVFDESGQMLAIGTTNTDVTERYRAQQAMRTSERRYRQLFESAPVVLAESDWSRGKKLVENLQLQGVTDIRQHLLDHPEVLQRQDQVMRVISVNREAVRVFGASSESELIQYAESELSDEQRRLLLDELTTFANGQRRSTVRGRNFRLDGEPFPVLRVAEITSRDADDWSRVLITMRDTSAEEAVRISEERYRRLFELAPAVLVESDWMPGKRLVDRLRAEGVDDIKRYLVDHPEILQRRVEVMRVLSVNQEAVRIYQAQDAETMIEKLEQEEMNESQRLGIIEELSSFADGERRCVVRNRTTRSNGTEFPITVESELLGDDLDDWSKVMLTIRDTSYEEAVRMSELRYRRLFDSAPVALYESDWTRGKKLVDDILAREVDDLGQYLMDHPELLRRRDEVLRIINCNSEALKVYQADSKESLMEAIEGEMTNEQRLSLIKVLEVFAAGRRRSSVRSWSRRQNGEMFPIVRDSELISSARDDWSRVLSSIHDLTAEVEAADRLREYQEELRSLAGKISLAEESERRRISSELHDNTIQNLVLARIQLANLKNSLGGEQEIKLAEEINQLLDSSLKETRSLIFEISPPVLYELGLEPAVEWLAEHYKQRTGVEVRINSDNGRTRLSEEMKIVLFQTTRELLVNIAKHAQAGRVSIDWQHNNQSVALTVQDDGVGFDINSSNVTRASEGGFGLFSIRERLKLLGAEIDIQSSSRGTRVGITAPAVAD